VPTIGYGTIALIDGQPVRLGDRITQEQAEALLMQECRSICTSIASLLNVDLSQNQWDALVSLSYNIGIGALADSTLLRFLNQSDWEAAAQQFLVWNHGTTNGIKQEIPGLTNRRREGKALFESSEAGGNPILLDQESPPSRGLAGRKSIARRGKRSSLAGLTRKSWRFSRSIPDRRCFSLRPSINIPTPPIF
jgi:GH24 family phage-related lysozyme (muramidase)